LKHEAIQYAQRVVSGDVVAGHYEVAACSRFLRDLEDGQDRGLRWDSQTADAYLEFFKRALVHTVGHHAGKPFLPLPWQTFVIANLYGWRREDGTRRFNYSYIAVARKNGKTTMMAGCALVALFFDQEPAAEVYTAATTRAQAKICLDEAIRMVRRSPILSRHLTTTKYEVEAPQLSGRLSSLSADAKTLDGRNVHTCIIDEYHEHPTDAVFNVLKSGMQSRTNPLHLTITTAGHSKTGPCYRLHRTCREILDGVKTDDAQFTMIFELDDGDDWSDPENWSKANPSLGSTLERSALDRQYQQAVNFGGSAEVEFRTKHCNEWVTSSATWIRDEHFTACKEVRPLSARCWAGLDLAATKDLTALAVIFPKDDGTVDVRCEYWLPQATVDLVLQENPGHIYREFIKLPNFHVTHGNVTDHSAIRRRVTGTYITAAGHQFDPSCWMKTHKLERLAFDRHNSTQIAVDLTDDNAPLAPFGQGFVSMSPAMKELEVLIMTGKIRHDGDPVLRWALANVELKMDPAGNIKADKARADDKIDPVVALAMAVGEWMKTPKPLTNEQFIVVDL
jgi:phage terminase large subunit-like protein